MTEIKRNETSYRTCLKCRQCMYIGSISGIVYRLISGNIYFLQQINVIHTQL